MRLDTRIGTSGCPGPLGDVATTGLLAVCQQPNRAGRRLPLLPAICSPARHPGSLGAVGFETRLEEGGGLAHLEFHEGIESTISNLKNSLQASIYRGLCAKHREALHERVCVVECCQ